MRTELEYVENPQHKILHEAGDKIEQAYFLNEGMASLVVLTGDGRSVEVAMVDAKESLGSPLAVGLSPWSVSEHYADPRYRSAHRV